MGSRSFAKRVTCFSFASKFRHRTQQTARLFSFHFASIMAIEVNREVILRLFHSTASLFPDFANSGVSGASRTPFRHRQEAETSKRWRRVVDYHVIQDIKAL